MNSYVAGPSAAVRRAGAISAKFVSLSSADLLYEPRERCSLCRITGAVSSSAQSETLAFLNGRKSDISKWWTHPPPIFAALKIASSGMGTE
jgi:hypothetical protein